MTAIRKGLAAGTVLVLFVAAALPIVDAATSPSSQPDAAAVPASQPAPSAEDLLTAIREAVPPVVSGDQTAEPPTDVMANLQAGKEALATLKKEYPQVARRPEVRIAELSIVFNTACAEHDVQMKDLRKLADSLLADPATPRPVRAMAQYHRLHADMLLLSSSQSPTTRPDDTPPWIRPELDKRLAFAREYKDLDIGKQAFGEAVIHRDQIDGYATAAPLVGEFVTLFPNDRAAQAMLLARLAFTEAARPAPADGWTTALPIMGRLKAEYRDQPVTVQALAMLTVYRGTSDPKDALRLANELTEQFTGEKEKEDVARCWEGLTFQAYRANNAAAMAARLRVLKEKFPKTQAVLETRAMLIWYDFRKKAPNSASTDLDPAVRADLDELFKDYPASVPVARLSVSIAEAHLDRVGYEKAAPFINDVRTRFANTPLIKELDRFIQRYREIQATRAAQAAAQARKRAAAKAATSQPQSHP